MLGKGYGGPNTVGASWIDMVFTGANGTPLEPTGRIWLTAINHQFQSAMAIGYIDLGVAGVTGIDRMTNQATNTLKVTDGNGNTIFEATAFAGAMTDIPGIITLRVTTNTHPNGMHIIAQGEGI